MVDIPKYQKNEIVKNLILLDGHIRQFMTNNRDDEKLFCKDCMQKHLLGLSGLAGESIKFLPEEKEYLIELGKWTEEAIENLPLLEKDDNVLRKYIEKIDWFRKKFSPVCYKCSLLGEEDKRQDDIEHLKDKEEVEHLK